MILKYRAGIRRDTQYRDFAGLSDRHLSEDRFMALYLNPAATENHTLLASKGISE